MIDDISRALVYIRDHINEHCPDADPNQIFLSGHSAGAHLITLLILDKSHLVRHNFSLLSIRGVISMSGVYSLKNPVHDSENNIHNWVFRILYSSNLLYPEGKQILEYSPIEYIKQDEELPPFLVMSAKSDMGLEIDAKRFVEKLKNCQHHVDYFIINSSHGTIASKFAKNDAHKHFFIFIRQYMKY
jgi:acetyl esterase/lipase